jgi:hypothetical protein
MDVKELDHQQFLAACAEQVAFWQKTLRLQDWVIDIECWPHHALETSVAKTVINHNNKSAILALRYPHQMGAVEYEWPEGEAGDYDLSIVHELLHLMFQPMESKNYTAEEQSCNLIASAMVSLYRARPQGPPTLSPCGGEEAHKASSPGHYM